MRVVLSTYGEKIKKAVEEFGFFSNKNRGFVKCGTSSLTTGADTVPGTGAADLINAKVATLGELDTVAGGAGEDTLSISETGAVADLGSATISGVEKLVIATTEGDIGSLGTAAGTTTAAVAQVQTIAPEVAGVFANGDVLTVTIGDAVYTTTVANAGGADEAGAALKALLEGKLGDDAANNDLVDVSAVSAAAGTLGQFTITSKKAGTALPKITITNSDATDTVKVGATGDTANVGKTGPGAIKEVVQITLGGTPQGGAPIMPNELSVGDAITVSVNGLDYTGAIGADATTGLGTVATAAASVATLINAALGAGTAVATGGVITVTAPAAGPALPYFNVTGASLSLTDAIAVVVANQAANAAGASAATISAPAGVTEFNASTADGNVKISGAATTDITAKGKAVSVAKGADVTVTASDSVYIGSAAGSVSVKTGTTSTSISDSSKSNASEYVAASDAAGVYVYGGTDVTVTGSYKTTAVKIGAAPYTQDAFGGAGAYPQRIGNLASAATDDVSVSRTTVDPKTYVATLETSRLYSTSAAEIYTNGAENVTLSGSGTATITDAQTQTTKSTVAADAVAGTSTLETVTLSGLSGTATIKSDAITDVFVRDTLTAQTVVVTDSGTEGVNSSLNFHVANLGAAGAPATRVVLTNDTATAVTIGSAAAATTSRIGATKVNTGSKSYIDIDTSKATSITMVNSLAVDIGAFITNAPKVASINASAATGGISAIIGSTPEQGTSILGGSGNDTVIVANAASLSTHTDGANTVVQLGAGNDVLTSLNQTAVAVVGATFTGGAGVDTLAASLLNAGNAAQFTGFEVLGLNIATTAGFDVTIMDGAVGLASMTDFATAVYTNVSTSQSLTYATVTGAAADSLSLDFGATVKLVGANDSYSVTMAAGVGTTVAGNTTAAEYGTLVVDGIENVNIVSSNTFGNSDNKLTLNSTTGKTVVITGEEKLTLDFAGGYGQAGGDAVNLRGVSLIDASASTGGVDIATAAIQQFVAGTTVKGGSGNDVITLANAQSLMVVEGGAGDDTIVTANAGGTLTGGAGADTFNVSASLYGAGVIVNIKDAASKDKITLLDAPDQTVGIAQDVSSAVSLASALATVTAGADEDFGWFQYAGNTYIVDQTAVNAGVAVGDLVVKLTGLVDLEGSVVDTAVLTIG